MPSSYVARSVRGVLLSFGILVVTFYVTKYFYHPHPVIHTATTVAKSPLWQHVLYTIAPFILLFLVLVWQFLRGSISLARAGGALLFMAVIIILPILQHHLFR